MSSRKEVRTMARREYMIEFRKKRCLTFETMAKVCKVSKTLLSMIEASEDVVTHPNIARRIGEKYRLTEAQIEGMMPENYRPSSPEYDPNKYRALEDMI